LVTQHVQACQQNFDILLISNFRRDLNIVYVLVGISLYTQPLKMELTQGSETSANYNFTPKKTYTKLRQFCQYKRKPLRTFQVVHNLENWFSSITIFPPVFIIIIIIIIITYCN